MSAIGNLLWFVFGGFIMGLGWWIVGLIAYVTIVGIPWGKACFVIGQFTFLPFGKEAISRKELTNEEDIGTSGLGDVYDQQIPVLKKYRFSKPGSYSMKFEQFMRTDTLAGILAVGFRLEATPTE